MELTESGHRAVVGHRHVTLGASLPAPTYDIPLPAPGMPRANVFSGSRVQRAPSEMVAPAQDLAGTGPALPWSSSQARPSSPRLRSCVPGQEEAFYLLVLFLARRCPSASASPG